MPEFLSAGWLDAMRRAADGADVPVVEPSIVVQQVVTDPDGADVTWWIELGGGTIALRGRAGPMRPPSPSPRTSRRPRPSTAAS